MTTRRLTFAALALYALTSLAVFATMLPHFSSQAIGDPYSDALKHVWGQWWVHQHLTENHVFPMEMDLANYPDGGRFFCLDGVNAAFTVLLRPFMNAVAAYNLLYLLHLTLAAWAAFLLAREVTGHPPAALFAGLVYGFSPYVLSFPVGSGVAETVFLFPLPLIILFALRTITHDSWINPIAAALLLLFQGLAAWSYGIYGSLFLFFLAVAYLLKIALHSRREACIFGNTGLDKRLLLRVALFAGILLVAALPPFFMVQRTVTGEDVMYERHLNFFPGPGPSPLEEPSLTNFSWVDFVYPGAGGRHIDMYTDKLTYVAYAGFTALLLALLALIARRRGAFVFGGIAALFFLFTLGPLLYATHAQTRPAPINPVYLAFYYVYPLFNATIHSVDRYAVVFQLALGVLAASGLTFLIEKLKPRWRSAVILLVCLLLMGEYLLLSPAPWPIPTSPAAPHPFSLELAAAPDRAAVLDFPPFHGETIGQVQSDAPPPLPPPPPDGGPAPEPPAQPYGQGKLGLFVGDIFFQQTIHGQPIPYNLEGVCETMSANVLYQHLQGLILDTVRPDTPACSGVAQLKEMGFGYFILHPDRLAPEARNPVLDLVEQCFGAGRAVDNLVVYEIKTE